jgi:hypothetical protein
MTTRMVSPKPLSDFVPDVTLIAFPIPRRDCRRRGRAFSSRESFLVSRQENGPMLMLKANSGTNLNSPWRKVAARVLDRCSRARNQRPHEILLIL